VSVYVDPLQPVPVCINPRNWRWPEACHLIADTVEELDDFARKLQLRRAWRQETDPPHYDLTAKRRQKAVAAGAIELTHQRFRQEWRRLTRHRR
jgi:hypothetical protein